MIREGYWWHFEAVDLDSGTVKNEIEFHFRSPTRVRGMLGDIRTFQAGCRQKKLNLRIDYGAGQGNNNGLYLQIGEAF